MTAVKLRPGLYRLDARCKCGGELRAERCGSGEFLWETFCAGCKKCDPNGWPTLKDCIDNARYFGGDRS